MVKYTSETCQLLAHSVQRGDVPLVVPKICLHKLVNFVSLFVNSTFLVVFVGLSRMISANVDTYKVRHFWGLTPVDLVFLLEMCFLGIQNRRGPHKHVQTLTPINTLTHILSLKYQN